MSRRDLRGLRAILLVCGECGGFGAQLLLCARSRAASMSAARRAFETVVPSFVSTASARNASSSGRKVIRFSHDKP